MHNAARVSAGGEHSEGDKCADQCREKLARLRVPPGWTWKFLFLGVSTGAPGPGGAGRVLRVPVAQSRVSTFPARVSAAVSGHPARCTPVHGTSVAGKRGSDARWRLEIRGGPCGCSLTRDRSVCRFSGLSRETRGCSCQFQPDSEFVCRRGTCCRRGRIFSDLEP